MKRITVAPLIVLVLAACQDQPLSTDAVDGRRGRVPPPAAGPVSSGPAGEIETLIRDLFPGPGLETAALARFRNVAREKEEGNLEDARSKAIALVGFTLEKLEEGRLEDPNADDPPTTAEAASELLDRLLAFVGLQPPEVSPGVLSGETDGVVAIASPDEDNLIVTGNEFAGTFIEAGDLAEETVVVIERLDPADQGEGDCLPAGSGLLEQREGCYRFDKSPDDPFLDDVLVAVCPEEGIRDESDPNVEQFQLGRFDPADPNAGVVGLPSASEGFLDCSDFGALAAADRGPLSRLARAGWRATAARLGRWLGPAPAEAVDLGFGGATPDFSRIGWVRLLDARAVAGDGQTDFAGFPVDVAPTVELGPAHPPNTTAVLEGVDVTFTVTGGGGRVDGAASVTVPTDVDGRASVPWRLGAAGPNELTASAAGESVVFGATADAPSLPIQCSGDGGGDRILNAGASSTLGRAFYVPGYPASGLSRVDLWFAADNPQGPALYTVELTVREDAFDGAVLGVAGTTVQLSGQRGDFTGATFGFQVGQITPGATVAFRPVVTDGPPVEVFMEVPSTDPDPGFPLPGDAACPIVETDDATAPLGTDRRQGVRAIVDDGS